MEPLAQLIEQLQKRDSLLVLGPQMGADSEPALRDLAALPFTKVVSLGNVHRLPPIWHRAGRQLVPQGMSVLTSGQIPWLSLANDNPANDARLITQLRLWLTTHTACFWGCSLEEEIIKSCYFHFDEEASSRRHRPGGWAILAAPPLQRAYWEQRSIHLLVGDTAEWATRLKQQWQGQGGDLHEQPRLPEGVEPYRFLAAYREEDAAHFFGREMAARDLTELVMDARLTLCFGPSGAGKSSLLQAGLMPLLRQQGRLPLYCRPAGDPLRALRQEIGALLTGPPATEDLPPLLAQLSAQTERPIVILWDQFEELFTLLGAEIGAQLAREIARCLRQPGLDVRFMLALREDFLAHLDGLKGELPQIFTQRFRVRPLSAAEARLAITRPAALCGMAYEPTLTERLLADLAADHDVISPADLQIVCGTLYARLQAQGGTQFRLADYEALGGKGEILGGYLERVIAGEAQPDAVRAVFKAMVTAQGTKVTLPEREISRLADVDLTETQNILRRLDQPHRLVRPLPRAEETWYELTHEIIGPRILSWLANREAREALALHDLLRAAQSSWQQLGIIPGAAQLRAVHEQRDNPHLRLSRADIELLLRGALAHGVEETFWLERATATGVAGEGLLQDALSSSVAATRARAAELLPAAQVVKLLQPRLRDADPVKRAQAAETLAGVDDKGAWRALRRTRHDRSESVRDVVWQGLSVIAPAGAQHLWRQDKLMPLLVAGSAVYWLVFGIHQRSFTTIDWLVVGATWLAVLFSLLWLGRQIPLAEETAVVAGDAESLPQRSRAAWLFSAGVWLALAWPLIAVWGWWRGLLIWLVVVWGIRGRLSWALAALLPFLPWFSFLPIAALTAPVVTTAMVGLVSLACLLAPRWGRYGADQPEALALLAGALGGVAGGWLAAAVEPGNGFLVVGAFLGSVLALGRQHARRATVYAGGNDIRTELADVGRVLWNALDQISWQLKPLLEGTLAAGWAALLLHWSAELAGGSAPGLTVGGALGLGFVLGLGLAWGRRGVWRWLLPLVGGGVGGWLALGPAGAVLGGCLGVGLAVGEWLAARGSGDGKA